MASGTIYGTTANSDIQARLVWSSTANKTDNTSTVTATLAYYKSTNATTYGTYFDGSIVINGNKKVLDKYYRDKLYLDKNAGWVTIDSHTITVSHNSDGKKTVSMSATGVLSGTTLSSTKLSGSAVLDNIPRAATLTAAPNFNDEANPAITYSNPAGSVVDSLQACIASSNGSTTYAAYRNISKTGTAYTFNLTSAERTILRKASTSNSLSVKFYVKTVIGSDTYYSSLSKTMTITNGKPTINPTITDTNSTTASLTGNSNTLIRYFSNTAITIGAAAVKEATIKSRKVVCGNKSLTADGTINAVESGSFVFTATDSRGNTTTKTVNKPIVNYIKLTCGLSNTSFNTDGEIGFSIKGNYFDSTFGATSNVLIVQYRYKLNNGSYGSWQTVTASISNNAYTATARITGLDYKKSYTIQARAIDELNTINSAAKVMTCIPVFDWSIDDFNFNVDVSMANNKSILGTRPDGTTTRAFTASNTNGNIVVGYDNYTNSNGNTNLYGNKVSLLTKNGADVDGMPLGVNRVLWSGSLYMNASHTANLSSNVSEQLTGIVLIFSRYDNSNSTALNEHFSYHFVPKQIVSLHNGNGSIFSMSTSNETYAGSKYLYISNDKITGHANNTATGTGATGVKYENNKWVLRYVIGV